METKGRANLPTKPILGAFAALLIALLGGLLLEAPRNSDLDRALQVSDLRHDLIEAQTSLLGARVDLYERNFCSASRQLEDARGLLRRAKERGRRFGWRDEMKQLDLASFEADIDEAQRLLGQFDHGANSLVPSGPRYLRSCTEELYVPAAVSRFRPL